MDRHNQLHMAARVYSKVYDVNHTPDAKQQPTMMQGWNKLAKNTATQMSQQSIKSRKNSQQPGYGGV